ncbi:TonB-dependent receptor [Terriglobus aquaticus]|uniref:TonB-dependent receptor domain-containing protein n=1 Tax=Terriglobus aquaticus TaxID=940139 RepID=A0ABW9KRQ4_9BACT|nr:TonB-dependent receptor [Terriglobus aquaticus]
MKHTFLPIALSAVLLAAPAPALLAQANAINGTLRGTITDAAGAPVPGATVTIKNLNNGFTRELTTNDDGRYVAPDLPLGDYTVTANAPSFAPLTQAGIHLDAGTDLSLNETLKAGSVATTVEVSADAPLLEVTRTDLGRTISSVETQNLPLTSRNPYNFILFQPGVTGHPNAENGVPRTLNTNGLVDRVNYQLDGMVDTESDRYGLRLFAISDSYTDTVQTISNGFNPEFGNTAGIIYNVITPAGTNNLHGAVQYIWRPKAASSCPMGQNCVPGTAGYQPKPNLHVDDLVGRLGGPVVRNRFFLFGAYEHLKRGNPQANTVTLANQAALIALGVPASDFNTAPQVQRAQWVDVRGDFILNSKNNGFVRYNYFRNNYPFNTNVGGQFLLSAESDFQDRAHIIGAQLVSTLTPNLLNEFRGSWPYRNQQHFAGSATGPGPMITISGVVSGFGGTNAAGDKYQEKIPSFNDNISLNRGAHAFKFGVSFQKNNDTQLADVYTQYTFPTLAAYAAAKNGTNRFSYSTIAASIGKPGAGYQTVFFGFFAQDTWALTQKLSATYGVRYDQYRAPNGIANAPLAETRSFRVPMANFAPRLGLAYNAQPGLVLRLSGGLYYEATPTNSYYNPLYSNGLTNTGNLITSLTPSSGVAFPGTFSAANQAQFPTPTPYALTSRFKNEYTWNVDAQVEQQLAKGDSLRIGYVLSNGRNLQFLRNSNLINPTSFLADGRPVYSTAVNANTRANPAFNAISYIDIGNNSSYHALIAAYNHRFSAGLTSSANFAWSHAIDNTPEGNTYEFSNFIEDPSNPRRDRGNSSINRPIGFNTSTVYQPTTHFANKYVRGLFNDNNFALLVNATSGDQQNLVTGTLLNNDPRSGGQQRPLFVARNTLRTPKIVQADLRYTRTFVTIAERVKPQIFVEANNLLNRSNFTTINTNATVNAAGVITGQPSLLPVSSVLEARILQFGARIDF